MMNGEDISAARKERGKLATAQQRRAANPLKSVWVEASAGTGKTKVLSDRVLRLLLSDLDGHATHSEMARDFLEVRLFGVLELGGAGEPVAGARALLLGVVDTATMVKEVLNSHWLRGSLTAS